MKELFSLGSSIIGSRAHTDLPLEIFREVFDLWGHIRAEFCTPLPLLKQLSVEAVV